MRPIIQLGPVELSTYAVMLSLAACLGFWLVYRESDRKGLDTLEVLKLTLVAFVAGLLGARWLAWLAGPASETRPLWSILAIGDGGGMSIYGAIGLSALAGARFGRSRGLDLWEVSDTLAFAFAPAIAVARLGCFLNGCCYGKATTVPWGLVAGGAPNHVNFGIPSHPTQLYEAGAAFALFAILWRMRRRRQFVGQLTVTFLAGYALFRFFNEMFRGDPRLAWEIGSLGAMSLNQLLSLVVLAAAVGVGIALERRSLQ